LKEKPLSLTDLPKPGETRSELVKNNPYKIQPRPEIPKLTLKPPYYDCHLWLALELERKGIDMSTTQWTQYGVFSRAGIDEKNQARIHDTFPVIEEDDKGAFIYRALYSPRALIIENIRLSPPEVYDSGNSIPDLIWAKDAMPKLEWHNIMYIGLEISHKDRNLNSEIGRLFEEEELKNLIEKSPTQGGHEYITLKLSLEKSSPQSRWFRRILGITQPSYIQEMLNEHMELSHEHLVIEMRVMKGNSAASDHQDHQDPNLPIIYSVTKNWEPHIFFTLGTWEEALSANAGPVVDGQKRRSSDDDDGPIKRSLPN